MTIASLMPLELLNFLRSLEEKGFLLCLVGGAPRDFLREGKLSLDLDFEVRHQSIDLLKTTLKAKSLSFEELPYQILRIQFSGFDVEFSLPRLENPLIDNKSHHHFEAVLDSKLSYSEAFKRRDFTMNAIGIEFNFKDGSEKIIDPYRGVLDLKQKNLREISDYFFLDSVRFLRLIRFALKYDLTISKSIKNKLGQFDLRELSQHHFKSELKKSQQAGAFINLFNELVKSYQLSVPESFSFWRNYQFSSDVLSSEDLLVSVFFKNPKDANKVVQFFSMPEKILKDLQSFSESFEKIKKITKDELKKIGNAPLSKESDLSLLKDLKNLEDKKEWAQYFKGALAISWNDWKGVSTSASEIESLDPSVRSFLRFYKAIKKVVNHA